MSLKQWFFGSERPGGEDSPEGGSQSAKNTGSSEDQEQSQFLTPEQLGIKRPEDDPPKEEKPEPKPAGEQKADAPKAMNSDKPSEDEKKPEAAPRPPPAEIEVEHTQILTKEEMLGLKSADEDRKKEEAAKDSSNQPEKSDPTDQPEKKEPEKPAAPAPPPAPLKAATWKTEPVKERWCPPETAKEFPELDRDDYQDHIYVERIVSEQWRVIGGSRRGRKQAFDNRFREDAMAFGHNDHATVLVVADGAGSSKYSRVGSHVAVHETVAQFLKLLKEADAEKLKDKESRSKLLKEFVTKAVQAGRGKVVNIAEKSKLSPKEFRATLLTVVHYHRDGEELLLSNQVGDGAISLLLKDKTLKKFGDADSGAFSGEVSCFLTDSEGQKKAETVNEFDELDKLDALFLCSDGIEDAFYPIDKKALDIYKQWMTGVDKPLDHFKDQPKQPGVFDQEAAGWALAQWLEFEKRGENDDRTVLLMHRRPPSVQF